MSFLDPKHLIETFGLVSLLVIIFLESGIFPAPLPGDSLLFTAGLLAADGNKYGLHIGPILIGSFICAIAGGQIGYEIAARLGTKLFRPGARIFKAEYEERSREFFERQGPKAVLLARFIPIVRTVMPIMAGVSELKRRSFVAYNLIGGAIWAIGISLAGFYLGKHVKNVDRYLLPIVALIVAVSLVPPALEYRRQHHR